jgi:aspartate-semialdehyde dehydrogenase
MLPVSELGNTAVEELHQQVIQLLSFGTPPTKVIGEQLAFNLLGPSDKDGGGKEIQPELTVAKEVCALSGLEENRVSVSLLLAPVFHSYAASLWVQIAEEATMGEIVAALGKRKDLDTNRRYEAPDGPPRVVSPAAVAGSKKVHVGAVRPDGRGEGGFWLWLAADSIAVDGAQNALELAKRLLANGGNRSS